MSLIDLLKRKQRELAHWIDETMKRLKQYDDLPHRTLVTRTSRRGDVYYYEQSFQNNKKVLHPLGDAGDETVIAYKQQRYLRKMLKVLTKDKESVDRFLTAYQDPSPDAVQEMLPVTYRDPTRGIPVGSEQRTAEYARLPDSITKDERFKELVKWAKEDYKRNPYPLPQDPNIARDGTPMRSKGECLWYDNILFEELPCHVDPEIVLKGRSGQWHKLYPDFVFRCFDGSFIYVEHFGNWGDDDYAETNKHKIQEYLDCGFTLGDNLIGTSDNAEYRTNELMIVEALEKIKGRMFR